MDNDQLQLQRTMQDELTLDYSKWSFQQRQQKLSDDHGLWQQQRDAVLDRRRRDNEAARASHLNNLDMQRKAKQDEADAQIEAELEPEKRRLQNEWLANNPNETAADFEKKAWHLLKANLIEQRQAQIMEATLQDIAASGKYSL